MPKGRVVARLGGNGSGKSTTLKAIMGVTPSQRGSIRLDGMEIRGLPAERIVPLGLSMVPQGRRIFAPLTVRENLRLGAFARRGRDDFQEDLETVLGRFPEIGEWLDRRGGALSVGQQQLVAFGRGLMARPKLLLMDEPSAGLAPRLVERLAEIIVDIRGAGTTILLVEQNVHLALSVADFGYVLRDGRIAMADHAQNLVGNDEIIRHYLGG
ncbi:MAG: ABC transporter ATP-binding protein [Hyphomicrobiaceae bacterium]|nr:MAG: ABC transporter ATP-binding protein [Hyphomicrobiaceae bacterium]